MIGVLLYRGNLNMDMHTVRMLMLLQVMDYQRLSTDLWELGES